VKALLIVGLAFTVVGALVLAWADLTGKMPTYDTLITDWRRRRRYALIGFPAIALGTVLQVVAVALD
jgi:hypothetical protein